MRQIRALCGNGLCARYKIFFFRSANACHFVSEALWGISYPISNSLVLLRFEVLMPSVDEKDHVYLRGFYSFFTNSPLPLPLHTYVVWLYIKNI